MYLEKKKVKVVVRDYFHTKIFRFVYLIKSRANLKKKMSKIN